MSKLVIKLKCLTKVDDRERIEEWIKKDLKENGFVLIDDMFEVYEVDDVEKMIVEQQGSDK